MSYRRNKNRKAWRRDGHAVPQIRLWRRRQWVDPRTVDLSPYDEAANVTAGW